MQMQKNLIFPERPKETNFVLDIHKSSLRYQGNMIHVVKQIKGEQLLVKGRYFNEVG